MKPHLVLVLALVLAAGSGGGEAGGGRSTVGEAGGGSGMDPLDRMRATYQSLEDKYLYESLDRDQQRLDEGQLRRTPEGRAWLAARHRLLESTRAGAARSGGEGARSAPLRDLPPGVTEAMVASAERTILYRQIAANGGWLDHYLKKAMLTPTESGAVARRQLTAGPRTPAEAALHITQVVDGRWRMPAAELGMLIRAALRRLPAEDRKRLEPQVTEFRSANDAAVTGLDVFVLSIGKKGTAEEERTALATHRALHRFSNASLKLAEAAEALQKYSPEPPATGRGGSPPAGGGQVGSSGARKPVNPDFEPDGDFDF
jgi:hypothetical protein